MASSVAVCTFQRDDAGAVQGFTFEPADVALISVIPDSLEWKRGKEAAAAGSRGRSKTLLHAHTV